LKQIRLWEWLVTSAAGACLALSLALVVIWVVDVPAAVRADSATPLPAPSGTPETATVRPEGSATAPAPIPTMAGMEDRRRVLVPPLPASATQADRGAQVYMLVCSACHGSNGQGLTDAWRATWAPEDQNCWQTKCHAASHPPDGFELPRYVPPAVGPAVTARFGTALDLYEYVRTTMPWHEPGSLLDDQYWDTTAFLLRMMGTDQGPVNIDRQNAGQIELPRLQEVAAAGTASPSPTAAPSARPAHITPTRTAPAASAGVPTPSERSFPGWPLILVLVAAGVAAGAWLIARSRRRS
jgi:mono/diheme cytochrome c family protein